MKTINKLLLFAIIVVIVITSSTCDKSPIYYITYEGHIYDTIGGSPASGIHIILRACQSGNGDKNSSCYTCTRIDIGDATTDASGYFKIRDKRPINRQYFVYYSNKYIDCISDSDLSNKYSILYLK